MKKNKTMIIAFITPAILSFAIMFLYPVLRTVFISFFSVESVTAPTDKWVSVGIDNYIKIWQNNAFRVSMFNIFKVWLIGGAIVLSISLLFAVILTSGVRFKSFWRAAIYLPNVISAVALATMWLQFVFQQKYGLINGFFKAILIVISCLLLYICSYLNPNILIINIDGNNLNLIDGMKAIFIAGIVLYGYNDLIKLKEILGVKTAIKETQYEIEEDIGIG